LPNRKTPVPLEFLFTGLKPGAPTESNSSPLPAKSKEQIPSALRAS
jgi:hypothetical protein